MRSDISGACAIVAAGGRGTRIGGDVPKQFRKLGGNPLYLFPVHSFLAAGIGHIVVVVPEEFVSSVVTECSSLGDRVRVARGGPRRKDSVASGFELVRRDASIVIVHDAARPFLPVSVVLSVVEAATAHGAALAALPVPDTLKESENGSVVNATVDRSTLYLAQTPQAFSHALLSQIVALESDEVEFTDEAMAAEHLGVSPHIVPGSSFCLKITTSDHVAMAEALYSWLAQRRTDHEDWFWLRHTSAC